MNQTPQELLAGARQIVEHLERSGLRLLPTPNDEWASSWPSANLAVNIRPSNSSSSQTPNENVLISDSSAVQMKAKEAFRKNSDAPAIPKPDGKVGGAMQPADLGNQGTFRSPDRHPSPIEGTSGPAISVSTESWSGKSLSLPEREAVFRSLKDQVAACRKCEALACSRKQTVFGVGALQAKVVFFGEAPGADEDRQGEPFVGAAGQLLNKIIVAAKMKREEVYILNSLKCRPPGNRTPVDEEIANCRPFFQQQLEVLRPEFIVCLGAVATRAVLQSTDSVGRLRGRFHRYRDARVLVTYHPAYLLRNESAKRLVWEDMQLLMKTMGLS